MVFGAVMPAFVGLANWMIPLMIGAPDMALPRMNNWSFWILPVAFGILLSTLLMPGGAPAGGWTMYPPLILQTGDAFPFLIFSVHLMGISSIMGSINVIVTIINMRAPDMTLLKMPMFVWTWLITAYLLIAVMPVLAGAVTMLLTDQFFGTSFFLAAGGGDPVMFQHIFWFFGHPEVYIMILPAFGVVSEIIPTFSRKKLFGHDSMVYAASCIAFLSFIVWAHHMFTVGMPLTGQLFFMFATMLIAVPTGVKIFNWVATMWRGAMTFETPMLFSLAFVFLFTIGGFSGLMLAIQPADVQYHDTYFVVAHFHYVLVPGSVFAIMAGAYYWLPKWTGHMYNEKLGKLHFWASTIFVNVTFFPQHFLGLAGMPRRIPDYSVQLRPVAAALRCCTPDRETGREGNGSRLGRFARPRVDRAFAGALAYVYDAAESAHRQRVFRVSNGRTRAQEKHPPYGFDRCGGCARLLYWFHHAGRYTLLMLT
jgi:cytochrome c oxidase subunit 1